MNFLTQRVFLDLGLRHNGPAYMFSYWAFTLYKYNVTQDTAKEITRNLFAVTVQNKPEYPVSWHSLSSCYAIRTECEHGEHSECYDSELVGLT